MNSQERIQIRKITDRDFFSWKIINWESYVALLKKNSIIEKHACLRPYTISISHETADTSEPYLDIEKQVALLFQLRSTDLYYFT